MSDHDTTGGSTNAASTAASTAASEGDARLERLRAELESVQAQRSALHKRPTASVSEAPASKRGVWMFAGVSLVFFLAMIAFALTRPAVAGFVGFEPLPELAPLEEREPLPPMPDVPVFEPTPATEEDTPAARGGTHGARHAQPDAPGNAPRIEIDRCGNDPLCGS